MAKISLDGLNKADVLAALYNASRPLGMGFLHFDPQPMTSTEAQELLDQTTYFDYLKGRVMKVDLSKSELDTWGYDRDNGEGAALTAISILSVSGNTNAPEIAAMSATGTVEAADIVQSHINEETTTEGISVHLGFADVAHVLAPAVNKAVGR